jgi:pimeloyl-ACP methyl ester carboxylesterase
MQNVRRYGRAPFGAAVIHGGPGAGGEMAPVARQLGASRGILEPIQTATSVAAQVAELRAALEAHADLPVILIGFSWGAWLSLMVAAHHPPIVRKLILVGSGPFEERYVARLREARMSRLTPEEQAEFDAILRSLGDPASGDKDRLLARLGALSAKTDAYDPIGDEPVEGDRVDPQGVIFQSVWEEAAEMRRTGRLLGLAQQLRCPVVAIHGDTDPHPAAGVREPLTEVLDDFRFILLPRCGHTPWMERHARAEFTTILESELNVSGTPSTAAGFPD